MPKKEFLKILNDNSNERLRVKLETKKGKLTDILFQYESLIKGKWVEIARYDCSHGYFHRDIINPNRTQEKTVVVISNLKDAAKYAEQDIKDRWEWYKERYIKKINNDK